MSLISDKQLHKAIEICTENHSTKLILNYVPKDCIVDDAIPLVILECVPSVINKLIEAGYMLGLASYGMYVDNMNVD